MASPQSLFSVYALSSGFFTSFWAIPLTSYFYFLLHPILTTKDGQMMTKAKHSLDCPFSAHTHTHIHTHTHTFHGHLFCAFRIKSKTFSMCAQSCLTLFNPLDYSQPSSSVHGIFHARILEWVAISSSRGCS